MDKSNGRVIALGFFDGVHVGHAALLKKTAQTAKELGVHSCALTFDTHPESLITGSKILLLNTVTERAELMRRLYGIEEVIFAHFDDSLMHLSWAEFIEDLLIGRFAAVHLVAGHDFHFGFKGDGNPQRLSEHCLKLGIGCDIISKVEIDSITVSSTYIRKLVAQGDMERAEKFLGHPHIITGRVVHGDRIGSTIGVPTTNMVLDESIQTPAFGVYITYACIDGVKYPALTNIGTRPTVDGRNIKVETHIFDFDSNLYGTEHKIEFIKYLRPEQKFLNLTELKSQIKSDIKHAHEYFAKIRPNTNATGALG